MASELWENAVLVIGQPTVDTTPRENKYPPS
jgi:hypothetical protein